jgi:5S rRNA maturation endonuclease (ribonuclease M5)
VKIDIKKLKPRIPVKEYFFSELGSPKQKNGNSQVFFCKFHDDKGTPNLTIFDDGGYKCFACEVAGGDVIDFHMRLHGTTLPITLEYLAKKYAPDLIKSKGKIVQVYPYRDETVRREPKDFFYRRPNGNGGYTNNLKDTRRILYRLPQLIESSDTVFIVGGEKDADTLSALGLTATTNPCGEGNWKAEFNEHLKGRDVVILEDNDASGRKHGKVISESLKKVANSTKIVRFQELPEHGDVSDFLEKNSKDDLLKRVEEAPLYKETYAEYFGDPEPEPDSKEACDVDSDDDADDERPTQSKILVGLAVDAVLFHDADGNCYVSILVDGHRENLRIRSRGFRNWLVRKFYETHEKPPGSQALSDALGVLEAKAQFEGEEHETHVRLAEANDKVYLDLCNDEWEVVEVDGEGSRVVTNPPVKFIRSKGMLPLPLPVDGGSIEELREFINIDSDESWVLLVRF